MARTSTRRWKGCPMCKPFKDASFGDANRIPYSVLKDFPTSDGSRVSRHDPGLWGEDESVLAEGPVQRRKKDTRRWCKGKTGREHKPAFVPRVRWGKPVGSICGWATRRTYYPSKDGWMCRHAEVCTACGKILREPWQIGFDCPDYNRAAAAA